MPLTRPVLTTLALALISGCSSADDPVTPPGGGGGGREIETNPSFSTTIQEIFERRGCTGSSCHGTARQEGLDLTAGNAYANLVNVQASQVALPRVVPGDADGSYLVIKLEGRQTVGTRMPQTGSALDVIDLTNIKNWINQGAQNN